MTGLDIIKNEIDEWGESLKSELESRHDYVQHIGMGIYKSIEEHITVLRQLKAAHNFLLNSESKINGQGSDSLGIHSVRDSNAEPTGLYYPEEKSLDSESLEKITEKTGLDLNAMIQKVDESLKETSSEELMEWLRSNRSSRSATK